jgi:phosphatidate cytidylyltransferase
LKAYLSKALQKRALSALVLIPLVLWMIVEGGAAFLFLLGFCVAVAGYEWLQLSMKTRHKAVFFVSGLAYILFSFACCYALREFYAVQAALLFILMVWASDTGGYIVGKLVGGPKLAASISPKKTWAGYAGALLFPAAAGALFRIGMDLYAGLPVTPGIAAVTTLAFLIAGAGVGIAGQAGDLLVSLAKRHAAVKDTGTLIPGHGGLLDRIDAMMLSAPVFLSLVAKFPDVFIP